MKVATKLAGGYAVLIGMMGILLLEHLDTIRQVSESTRRLSETTARVALSTTTGLRLLDEMQDAAEKYALLKDEGYARGYAAARQAYDEAVARLSGLSLRGEERSAVDSLAAAWRGFVVAAPALASLAAGPPALQDSLAEHFTALRQRTSRVGLAAERAAVAEIRRSEEAAREAERATRLTVTLAAAAGLLICLLVVRSITERLERLKGATHAVAEGDFSVRLDESRGDEFADVARDFNVMAARLAEVERAKREFFSSVSHNLKSPLASMQETARLLLDRLPGELNEKQERLLRLSMESGDRLALMISNLLDLASMEAGAMEYRLDRVDLAAMVRRLAERYRACLAGREISVEVEAPAELVAACDADRVEQALENLLENAVRFSPDGGEIRLVATRQDRSPPGAEGGIGSTSPEWVALEVRDRGPGVRPEHRERIFERFHQVRTAERLPGAGVGLGLAICREIAAAHRGSVWVEENPGGGSAFILLLPEAREGDGSPSAEGGIRAARGRDSAGGEGPPRAPEGREGSPRGSRISLAPTARSAPDA